MRVPQRIAAGLTLLLAAAACQPAELEISEQDIDSIREQIDTYVRHALAGDWDAWGTTLMSDVIALPPNQAPLLGRDAVVAWGKTFPRLTAFTVSVDEIEGRGDMAYARGTYSLAAMLPDSTSLTETGSFMEIHRRQADGSWPYSRLIWHSDAPLAAQPPM